MTLDPHQLAADSERSSERSESSSVRSNDQWIQALSGEPDSAALDDLRRRLVRGLRGALSSELDEAFLEDIVQETLMKILKNIDAFRGDSRFLTWSLTIASRTAWTELRRKRWKDVSLDDLTASNAGFQPASEDADFEADPDRAAIRRLLERLIETRLTERQRTALKAELHGMPQEEIARRLGGKRNAIYKLVHDARKKLKRELESSGFGAEQALAAIRR